VSVVVAETRTCTDCWFQACQESYRARSDIRCPCCRAGHYRTAEAKEIDRLLHLLDGG
jgi:hypothetical protein